jgi:hypothetical protein
MASQVFRSLDVAPLSKEELRTLCSLGGLHWCFLNESIGVTITELVELLKAIESKVDVHARQIGDVEREHARDASN